jgi:hypothetical protein
MARVMRSLRMLVSAELASVWTWVMMLARVPIAALYIRVRGGAQQ